MTGSLKAQLDSLVAQSLQPFFEMSQEDRERVPECESFGVDLGRRKATVTIFRGSTNSEERVVVQAICPRFGGLTTVISVMGIAIGSNSVRPLREDELWEYS